MKKIMLCLLVLCIGSYVMAQKEDTARGGAILKQLPNGVTMDSAGELLQTWKPIVKQRSAYLGNGYGFDRLDTVKAVMFVSSDTSGVKSQFGRFQSKTCADVGCNGVHSKMYLDNKMNHGEWIFDYEKPMSGMIFWEYGYVVYNGLINVVAYLDMNKKPLVNRIVWMHKSVK